MRYSRTDKAAARPQPAPFPETWLTLLSTYAVIVCAALTLAVAEGTLIYVFVALVGSAAHALLIGPGGKPYLSPGASKILAVGALAFGLWQTNDLNVHFSYAVAHFLILVQLVQLFGKHHLRELRLIQVAALFEVLVAGVWALEMIYLPVFLLTALCLMANFVALQMHAEGSPFAEGSAAFLAGRREHGGRQLFSALWLPATAVFISTGLLFLVLPRFQTYAEGTMMEMSDSVTGFSENVSLRDVGKMRESQEVALLAQFGEEQGERIRTTKPSRVLMRGTSLAAYSSGRWFGYSQAMFRGSYGGNVNEALANSQFTDMRVYKLDGLDVKTRTIHQKITLQLKGVHTAFALYRPIQLAGASPYARFMDPVGHKLDSALVRPGTSYMITSLVPEFTADQLRTAGAPRPTPQTAFFWDAPDDLRSVLRDTIAQIDLIYAPKTDYDRVMASQRYLMNTKRFTYTLDLPDFGEQEPIAAFLTDTHRGSCEQFSSAMALILRAWDIPTRLVIGFKEGEYDAATASYTFRNKDAHAWLEVFFNGLGWVEFDPTPASADVPSADASGGGGVTGFLSRVKNTFAKSRQRLDAQWAKNIIGYGKTQQQQMLNSVSVNIWSVTSDIKAMLSTFWPALPAMGVLHIALLIVTAVFALSSLVVLARWIYRRSGWRRSPRPGGPTLRFYEELLRVLRRKGLIRPQHWTPREFANSAATELARTNEDGRQVTAALQLVTELYYRVRFGRYEMSEAEQAQVRQALHILAAAQPANLKAARREPT